MAKKPSKEQIDKTLTEIRAVNTVVEKYKDLENAMTSMRYDFRTAHEIYMGTYTGVFYKGTSRVKSDSIFKAVESLIANLDNIYWRNTPPFNGKPTEGSDVELMRNIHMPLMEHQLDRVMFRDATERLFRMGAKYGTFIAMKAWDRNTDFLKLIPIDPNTVYYDTTKNNVKDLDIVIRKKKNVSFDHLKKMGYKNLELLVLPENMLHMDRDEKEQATDNAIGNTEGYEGTNAAGYNALTAKHEVLEADVSWDVNGDGTVFEEYIVTVINRRVLARMEKNPFNEKRYYFCPFIEVEDSLAGIGVCMAAKNQWIELTDTLNQMNDNVTRNLNEHRYVDENLIRNKRKFEYQMKNREYGITMVDGNPGQGIMVDRPPLFLNEIRNKAEANESSIMGWSGAFLVQQGMPMGRATTATEAANVINKSDLRILLMMRRIENRVLNPFMRDVFRYNTGYYGSMRLSEKAFRRILGEKALMYTTDERKFPGSIKDEFDFFFGGSTEAENRLQKAQQLMNFVNIYVKIPPQMLQNPSLNFLLRKEYELITGAKDGDEIFPKEAPKEFVNPEHENVLLDNGGFILPNPMENFDAHLKSHYEHYQNGSPKYPVKLQAHIVLTEQMAGQKTQGGGQPGTPTQEQSPQTEPRQQGAVSGNFGGGGVGTETQT
jgi:hypothetical protein